MPQSKTQKGGKFIALLCNFSMQNQMSTNNPVSFLHCPQSILQLQYVQFFISSQNVTILLPNSLYKVGYINMYIHTSYTYTYIPFLHTYSTLTWGDIYYIANVNCLIACIIASKVFIFLKVFLFFI